FGYGEPLTYFTDSLDSIELNDDNPVQINYIARPSLFYPRSININERRIPTNEISFLRNVWRYFHRFWFCISGNTKYKRSIRKRTSRFGVNSRSELDSFARIVFPTGFILFNILYWFYFLHFQK
ncbi:unnamed protein product, partial [Rotaria socialis]